MNARTPSKRTQPNRRKQRYIRRQAKRRRRVVALGVLGAAIVVVGAVWLISRSGGDDGPAGTITADGWDLPRLDQPGRLTLKSFNGKPTVVAFFSSSCPDCETELQHVVDVAAKQKSSVNFVFVNSTETGDWRSIAGRRGVLAGKFPVARDIKGNNANGLLTTIGGAGNRPPLAAFYDGTGKLVDQAQGMIDNDLENRLVANFKLTVEGASPTTTTVAGASGASGASGATGASGAPAPASATTGANVGAITPATS